MDPRSSKAAMGVARAGRRAQNRFLKKIATEHPRCPFLHHRHVLPLFHKSVQLCLCDPLTVSDLFFAFFVDFSGVF